MWVFCFDSKLCATMYSSQSTKTHCIAPNDQDNSTNEAKKSSRRCQCGLAFCQKGDLQAMLASLGCDEANELLKFKNIFATKSDSPHVQRKQYAFLKSLGFYLNLSDSPETNGKRYLIHKFHWPVSLVLKNLAARHC